MLKLYEVKRDTRVRVMEDDFDLEVHYHHLDGAYSYCTTDDGEVVHLAAWTKVEVLDAE